MPDDQTVTLQPVEWQQVIEILATAPCAWKITHPLMVKLLQQTQQQQQQGQMMGASQGANGAGLTVGVP